MKRDSTEKLNLDSETMQIQSTGEQWKVWDAGQRCPDVVPLSGGDDEEGCARAGVIGMLFFQAVGSFSGLTSHITPYLPCLPSPFQARVVWQNIQDKLSIGFFLPTPGREEGGCLVLCSRGSC